MQTKWIIPILLAVAAGLAGNSLCAESGALAPSHLGPPEVEVIMLTGDPLPGQDGEADRFSPPTLAGDGQVAFQHIAFLATLDAVYHYQSGTISPIAIRDDSTIGEEYQISGGEFGTGDGRVTVNSDGKMIFNASIQPIEGSGTDDALVVGTPGGELALAVKDGDPSPDGNGMISNGKVRPGVINQAGQIAFSNRISDSDGGFDDNEAIFFRDGTSEPLEIVARRGDPVPGSTEFTFGDPSTPVLNDNGWVAFSTQFPQAGSTSAGVFVWDGTEVQTVSMTGDPWPGCNGSDLARHFRFDFNNAGQTLFTATCGSFSPSSTPRLVMLHDGNNLNLLAASGDNIPGLVDETYNSFWRVRLNNAGDAVFIFRAGLGSDPGIGLYDGELKTIAASSQPAPGGGTFRTGSSTFRNININDAGQVVFSASVDDVDGETRRGIFFYDGAGNLQQILRHDNALLGSTIDSFSIREGWPRGNQAIDDEGRVGISFRLEDDRRGILIADGNLAGDRVFGDRFQQDSRNF